MTALRVIEAYVPREVFISTNDRARPLHAPFPRREQEELLKQEQLKQLKMQEEAERNLTRTKEQNMDKSTHFRCMYLCLGVFKDQMPSK